VLGATTAGFGVYEPGELGGGFEGGQLGGRAGVAHRVALVIKGSFGEQAGELDLTGVRPASPPLQGRPPVSAATMGTPVPSTAR
jgi:hypothetical protein